MRSLLLALALMAGARVRLHRQDTTAAGILADDNWDIRHQRIPR